MPSAQNDFEIRLKENVDKHRVETLCDKLDLDILYYDTEENNLHVEAPYGVTLGELSRNFSQFADKVI